MFFPCQLHAETYYFELTPGISVGEVYDDNLNLDDTDKKSDFITTLAPSINLSAKLKKTDIEFQYTPTFVNYDRENQNNTVRHEGSLFYSQELAERFKLDLTETYSRTEDPTGGTEGEEFARTSRAIHQRNTGQASIEYLFGPKDTLVLGYSHSVSKNEDLTVNGGTIQNPFANVTYWINIKNGVGLDYQFTKADFTTGEIAAQDNDHTGHDIGLNYFHLFTPNINGFINYNLTTRQFLGDSEDFRVHEGSIGFDQTLSPRLSYSLGAGYFFQQKERTEGDSGLSMDANLMKNLERGSLSITGSGGWSETYLDVERSGFSQYWSVGANFQYQLMEKLNSYVNGSYRWDKDEEDKVWEVRGAEFGLDWEMLEALSMEMSYNYSESREWQMIGGGLGVKWDFSRWFHLSMNYTYAQRDDDDDEANYESNRVMLTITGIRMFKY